MDGSEGTIQLKAAIHAERPGPSSPVPGRSRERLALHLVPSPVSAWTRSRAKRFFDLAVVITTLPVAAALCLLLGIVIRISSRGPVFFLQTRIGRHGKRFSIVKFRTMRQSDSPAGTSIATIDNERITGAGRFLRHWKLDELPQLLNVLRGEMSLVGPRPRVPEQQRKAQFSAGRESRGLHLWPLRARKYYSPRSPGTISITTMPIGSCRSSSASTTHTWREPRFSWT